MITAERLFAERGIAAVSARQISEAAGQGNTAAVGYHFGTKDGLIQAIIARHAEDIERIRSRMTAAVRDASLRDWVSCLVRPSAEHLASLGPPTWFARFAVQVLADPALRPLLLKETFATPTLGTILRGLDESLAGLPPAVRAERDDMVNVLIMHAVAQHERVLADRANQADSADRGSADRGSAHRGSAHRGSADRAGGQGNTGSADPVPGDVRASWRDAATGLIDALVGLYQAPITETPRPSPNPRGR